MLRSSEGRNKSIRRGYPELTSGFSGIGQPVLVPGDMGTSSYVMAGPEKGYNQAFGSSCHGAGRAMSRTEARHKIDGKLV